MKYRSRTFNRCFKGDQITPIEDFKEPPPLIDLTSDVAAPSSLSDSTRENPSDSDGPPPLEALTSDYDSPSYSDGPDPLVHDDTTDSDLPELYCSEEEVPNGPDPLVHHDSTDSDLVDLHCYEEEVVVGPNVI